ncbi:DsbA family protein [Pseudonocardia sp. HH130629-09]|uniref:DsbA family protein n=1 Tax=Pseudonocardia sp. HH130629-09 TaxID=1641402 RepID=UPI0006CB1DB2|nr:thioredoxin domain-containing protein [Pseudonocardia sp. HH130629-09]ALE85079.1 protein-disulfide isomerase [Pseudonocardia sp. HH130629-09]
MGQNERERRAAAQARLQAAGITSAKTSGGLGRNLAIGALVLIVALAAGGYVLWQNYGAATGPTYPVARDGVVVRAGNQAAPVTVDVYEDYLCPSCKQFESFYADDLTAAMNENRAKVNYHHIVILDERSSPPGYSTRAGNAALCAADAGIFPAYHSRLYADQPAEGSAGTSVQELTALGAELGATGDFSGCVARQANSQAIADATGAAAADPAAAPGGRFGTPTVLVDGVKMDLSNGDWLSRVTG